MRLIAQTTTEEFDLMGSIVAAFKDFGITMAQAVPKLVMVIVVLLAGYLVARIVTMVITKALTAIKFDDMAVKIKLDEPMKVVGIKSLSKFIGKTVYWLIMFVVIKSAADRMEIAIISEQIQKIINFIPYLISAVLILLAGYFVAVKLKTVILNVTRSLGSNAGSVLANIVYYFIMIMVVITAIEQTGIGTDLISHNILLIVGAVLFAGAVAYGFAAREIMRNMLSAFFSKRNFRKGQIVKLNELEGEIIDLDNQSYTIETEGGKVIVPAKDFIANHVIIVKE